MTTARDVLKLLADGGVIPSDVARPIAARLEENEDTATVQAVAAELHESGLITTLVKTALDAGTPDDIVVNGYVLLEVIGRGGMGIVYRARQTVMKRDVAVKILREEVGAQPGGVARFQREVHAAAQLSHPNIATGLDAGCHADRYYLVMEYVRGRNLDQTVRSRGRLDVETALNFALQVAKGLEYAHRQGVVHRDVKPSNLLVTERGEVKILDLGLSRITHSAPHGGDGHGAAELLTASGQFMGTATFMAPEQAVSPHQADHRADLYSLGCTLYFMLTGRPPYREPSHIRQVIAHREAPIPHLRDLVADVPALVDELCTRMLAKRPEERHQSFGELIRDIELCLHPSGMGSSPGSQTANLSGPTRITPRARHRSWSVVAPVAMVLALVAIIAGVEGVKRWGPAADAKNANAAPLVSTEPPSGAVSTTPTTLKVGNLNSSEVSPIDADPALDIDYVLAATVRRVSGLGPFAVVLRCGSGQAVVLIDREDGHAAILGFEPNTKKAALKHESGPTLGDEPSTVTCTVSRTGVAATVNGTTVFDWAGDPRQLILAQGWTAKPGRCYLGGNKAVFEVLSHEIKPLP